MQEPQLVVMTRMKFQEKLFIVKTQTDGHGPEQHLCNIRQLPIKVSCKGSEAWKYRIGEPNVRLIKIVLASNLIAFLVVLADMCK